jgi:dTDP-4-amino-4,6-dideoxygalactose transaminase
VIRFLDLAEIHRPILSDLQAAVARVVASGHFILGPELEAFEDELADHSGVRHAVGVGNGLDALSLTLRAAGIGPGDEVLVPGNTFVATWLAVSLVGARPVPVEPDPVTHNLDPDAIEAAISPRTAGIIPVHLYGQPARMDQIGRIAATHSLFVLGDGAQSVGARLNGLPVAAHAPATTLSFYPGKNLGALGDGGAVLTNDPDLADKIRLLRNYGSRRKYEHEVAGQNSRLDEIQAAVLRVKLHHLDAWNDRRRAIAARYSQGLVDTSLGLPGVASGAEPVWHLYVITSERRDDLAEHLHRQGIETLIHYPVPPHRQAAYAAEGWRLPQTDRLAGQVLSLPMGPHLNDERCSRVVEAVSAFSR